MQLSEICAIQKGNLYITGPLFITAENLEKSQTVAESIWKCFHEGCVILGISELCYRRAKRAEINFFDWGYSRKYYVEF